MNAAKFIAEKGWEYTKKHLEKMDAENWYNGWFDDLKRYVDAWELVQRFGGFKPSKKILKRAYDSCSSIISDNRIGFECSWIELRKAITLVEEVESLKEVG